MEEPQQSTTYKRPLTVVELKRFGLPIGDVHHTKLGEEF